MDDATHIRWRDNCSLMGEGKDSSFSVECTVSACASTAEREIWCARVEHAVVYANAARVCVVEDCKEENQLSADRRLDARTIQFTYFH